ASEIGGPAQEKGGARAHPRATLPTSALSPSLRAVLHDEATCRGVRPRRPHPILPFDAEPIMGRELRLGFAMGGGVSLGAFSGAALTEAMKLAVVRATYTVDDPSDPRHGERVPYDRVVVEVFGGARAGALSLVLMLRSLVEPDPAPDVEARLRAQFPEEYDRLDDARRAQLIAAQHAQD